MLLSIALMPVLAPRFWHRRMNSIALGWSLALLVPLAIFSGIPATAAVVWHALLTEYLPFVTLLLALYTAAGGISGARRPDRLGGEQHPAAGDRHRAGR